jgi:ankyrin repeat protein
MAQPHALWGFLPRTSLLCWAAVTLIALAALAPHPVNAQAAPVPGGIHEAARNGDLSKVQALVKANPDLVSSRDSNGLTPLHWAAGMNHADVVEWLLANRTEINAQSSNGSTPLHLAAFNGHKETAEALLAHGAEVNARNNDAWAPLHGTARYDHAAVAELLLAHGADVNAATSNGATALHMAAAFGYNDVLEVLLAHQADVNLKESQGSTPLDLAAANTRPLAASILRQHGGQGKSADSAPATPATPARASGPDAPASACIVQGLVRDARGLPLPNAEVVVDHAQKSLRASTTRSGEYSVSVPTAGGLVRVTVSGWKFEPVSAETEAPEGSPSCKADFVLLTKSQQKMRSQPAQVVCQAPAPYASMLAFQAALECNNATGRGKCSGMFLFGSFVLQMSPAARLPVDVRVSGAPADAFWVLSNPEVAVLVKIQPEAARIEFATDGATDLVVQTAARVLLRVHLQAGSSPDMWQVTASRVTEKGERIDMDGRVVK